MSANGTNGSKRPVSSEERDAVNSACKAADGFSAIGGLTICRIVFRVHAACGKPTFKDLGTQLSFSRVGTDTDGNAEVQTVGRSESWVSRRLGRKGALAYARNLSGDAVLASVAECSKAVKSWTPDQHAEFLRRLHGKAVETVRSGAAGKRTGARKSRGCMELLHAAARKADEETIGRSAFLTAAENAYDTVLAAAAAAESQTDSESATDGETDSKTELAAEPQLIGEPVAVSSFASQFAEAFGRHIGHIQ